MRKTVETPPADAQKQKAAFDGICQIVKEELALDGRKLSEEDRLYYDLGADSLDMLIIIKKVEERFGIRININDKNWDKGSTLRDNSEAVARLMP